ncbi:MAG: nickel pincer cofactor biosynthesis protein LarC [Ardenticatenia bacterium]|nr:nickel pincer cofactor biosynthesis protein LarC [Ardenticatenia bacterium]
MIGYLDLPSGLSGNMMLGCLVDAGWSADALREVLAGLPISPQSYEIRAESVHRRGIRATLITVTCTGDQPLRTLADVRDLLERARLPVHVKEAALGTFTRLAEAEARVHGLPVDQIHFHEVGAVDALVDIVGTAAGLHALGVEHLYASPLPLGHGWAQSAHGPLPLPAPATLQLLASVNAPTCPAPGEGELVTPTGAAILAHHATFTRPAMRLHKVAYGAGHRDYPWPNVARLWLGEPTSSPQSPLVVLETNIDDMNPELYGAVSDALFEAGALDVWLTPVHMKKGRPGTVLSVLAPAPLETTLSEVLLEETTTLGVRVLPIRRHEAPRAWQEVETPFGRVRVKLKVVAGRVAGAAPEYEECRRLAREHDVPVRRVYEAAFAAAHRLLHSPEMLAEGETAP